MKRIGIYENPAVKDAGKIADDINAARKHEDLISKGFTCVGSFRAGVKEEEEAFINRFLEVAEK